MLRTGVDIIEISRVAAAINRYGDHFLARVYTPTELDQCNGRVESLAARFCAKEAAAKALGTGIWRFGINWKDIEIQREKGSGAPTLTLHNAAGARASALSLIEWSVSLSHDRHSSIAFVVANGPVCPPG